MVGLSEQYECKSETFELIEESFTYISIKIEVISPEGEEKR